jgi:hypothetical protein
MSLLFSDTELFSLGLPVAFQRRIISVANRIQTDTLGLPAAGKNLDIAKYL